MEIHPTMMLYQLANFIILMVVLGLIFNKAIRPFMRKRTAELKHAFQEIELRRKEVEELTPKYEEQLHEMKEQARSEMEKAVSAGHAIRTEIVQTGKKEAEEFLARARQEIDSERERALNEIRQEMANLSVSVAEKLIRRNLNTDDNRRLVEEFIAEVSSTKADKVH
jgi:F-type H+-transporting ATPase subunit b